MLQETRRHERQSPSRPAETRRLAGSDRAKAVHAQRQCGRYPRGRQRIPHHHAAWRCAAQCRLDTGRQVQLQLGGWTQRTYTPLDWDAVNGRTRILVHLQADGPGTSWARSVRKGDACVLFGPRKSVNLAQSGAPVIVFGDETSLGVATALSAHGQAPAVQVLLEVSSLAETTPVIAQLGLVAPLMFERRDSDSHLREVEAGMSNALMQDATADIVLTGRASALQQMTRFLRQTGVGSGRRHTKAYWAAGKIGLD